jgi:hypothetical protein
MFFKVPANVGITSPMLYLIYINDLLNELESSGLGICVFDIHTSSSTVADDLDLISYSKAGL